MEENIIQQNDIKSIEYRTMMEAQLAQDFWFMCREKPDYFGVDDWSELCIEMECGNGWLAAWYDTCRQLLTEVKSDFGISQFKEKFGTANVYYYGGITPYGQQLIHEFEEESADICEVCGKSGKLRGKGCYMTLCDECWKESQNER